MGAVTYFSSHAKAVATGAGVGFDQHAFFVMEVARDQLTGAVATVANCSHDAVAIAAFRLEDKVKSDAGEKVFERIAEVFPRHAIARDAEIRSSSTFRWHVATLVTFESKRCIFDAVTPHHNSVVNAAAKFHDIAHLEDPPGRVAMVHSRRAFDRHLGLLTPASKVIELRVQMKRLSS
jgi:hypothetical protein